MGNSLFDISDKVVVITGGSGVLGSKMAEYLLSEGAKVAIIGRTSYKALRETYLIKNSSYRSKILWLINGTVSMGLSMQQGAICPVQQ